MNIHDLNISDLREFLSANHIKYFDNIYNIAFDLMKNKNTKYDNVPISIIQWMLAHNALQRKINIPNYTISQIKKSKLIDLDRLSKSLGLTKSNIDNVINVLLFMHKLKESELDFEVNTDLYSNLLINSKFETIIKLLKAKPSLKDRISELFYDILIYNKGIPNFYNETSKFVRALIDLKYFNLVEKILPIIIKDDDHNYFNLVELFAEKRYLDKYFKHFPMGYHTAFKINIVKALNNAKVSPYYLLQKILETAINNKNLNMINSILDQLIFESKNENYKYDYNKMFYVKFYGQFFFVTDEERNNLKILINEAKKLAEELILNL